MTKSHNKKMLKISKLNYFSLALIVILIVSQVVSIIYIVKLRESTLSLEDRYFLGFVNQVETQRYKRAVVDVPERKIYIPDAQIYAPFTDIDPEIMYDSTQLEKTGPRILYLSMAQVVGNQRSLDDSVDSHSCDKMIVISSDTQSGYIFIKEMPTTKDGLKYVYLRPNEHCGIYSRSGWDNAKNIAENIQNY